MDQIEYTYRIKSVDKIRQKKCFKNREIISAFNFFFEKSDFTFEYDSHVQLLYNQIYDLTRCRVFSDGQLNGSSTCQSSVIGRINLQNVGFTSSTLTTSRVDANCCQCHVTGTCHISHITLVAEFRGIRSRRWTPTQIDDHRFLALIFGLQE